MLHLRHVRKTYASPDGGAATILQIEDFALADGAQAALTGPSGSGKSTLLHIVAGILRPDTGQVLVNGTDIAALSESEGDRFRARHIGIVYQEFNLLAGYTALENVLVGMMFGEGMDRPRAEELLRRLDLANRMRHYPRQLSLGQQQRVALARALANRPKLLLADEPTGSLDSKRTEEAIALFRQVAIDEEATLLVATHDPAVVDAFPEHHSLESLNTAGSAP